MYQRNERKYLVVNFQDYNNNRILVMWLEPRQMWPQQSVICRNCCEENCL